MHSLSTNDAEYQCFCYVQLNNLFNKLSIYRGVAISWHKKGIQWASWRSCWSLWWQNIPRIMGTDCALLWFRVSLFDFTMVRLGDLTHWPLKDLTTVSFRKFQTNFSDKYLKYFLWNSNQVNATTPHRSLVNVGSGNGVEPSVRQEAITWANVDLDPCCHMTSLGHLIYWGF